MMKQDMMLHAAMVLALGLCSMSTTAAGENKAAPSEMHMHHHMHMPKPTMLPVTTRRLVNYTLPKVKLVREDHKRVTLPEDLNDGRPVVLTFVFTTCTAICPIISHTLAQLQDKLGPDRDRIHMATVTIDPENDTPTQLAAYGRKYHAGPEWHSYTGSFAASRAVQRAFDVYHGDKMEHDPVVFLRRAPGHKWVRIDGFATANDLLAELRSMLAFTN